MKVIFISIVILLSGCDKASNSEFAAHRAWASVCEDKTVRYQTSEKPDGLMVFTATCQREKP